MRSFSLVVILAVSSFLAAEGGDPQKEVKKWVEKISHYQFMEKCMGQKTMLKFFGAMERFGEECMQLTPAFEIDLFDDSDGANEISDDFDQTFVQGIQTLPAEIPASFVGTKFGASSPPAGNPWQAWMSFWASQYAQNQGRSFNQYPASNFYGGRLQKRAIKPPTDKDLMDFAEDVAEFKADKKYTVGNMTCILTKFGALDANLDVKLSYFTRDMWTQFDRSEQPDPEFKAKMNECYQHCYQMSKSIPENVLAAFGPGMKQFGRQKKFFKCVKFMENAMCAKKELHNWIEVLYGKFSEQDRINVGLPKDKYDAAMMVFKVKEASKSPMQREIADFMFGPM